MLCHVHFSTFDEFDERAVPCSCHGDRCKAGVLSETAIKRHLLVRSRLLVGDEGSSEQDSVRWNVEHPTPSFDSLIVDGRGCWSLC